MFYNAVKKSHFYKLSVYWEEETQLKIMSIDKKSALWKHGVCLQELAINCGFPLMQDKVLAFERGATAA